MTEERYKGDNISSVIWFDNLHLTFIFIAVINVDVSSDFFFFSAVLDLQSIRDDDATNFL